MQTKHFLLHSSDWQGLSLRDIIIQIQVIYQKEEERDLNILQAFLLPLFKISYRAKK